MIQCVSNVLILAIFFFATPLFADVVVLVNRLSRPIKVVMTWPEGESDEQQSTVAARGSITVPTRTGFTMKFEGQEAALERNSIYEFSLVDKKIQFRRLNIRPSRVSRPLPTVAELRKPFPIKVKVFVDEEEPGVDAIWQGRLRERLAAVSKVLERQCFLRLQIVGFGTWDSDDNVEDTAEAAREFAKETDAGTAHVAIGFTKQLLIEDRKATSGVLAPLGKHLLIREKTVRLNEPLRVKWLLHEIGRWLGGSNSSETSSLLHGVKWRDQKLVSDDFDGLNSMLLYLIGEELRVRNIRDLAQLSPQAKYVVSQLYATIDQQHKQDQHSSIDSHLAKLTKRRPLEDATRNVLLAITQAGDANRRRATPLTKDALFEHLIKAAARAARKQIASHQVPAFLLGIGIGLDDSKVLLRQDALQRFVRAVESPVERQRRVKAIGRPTILNRRDLAQHFVVSSYLTVAGGATASSLIGTLKEVLDKLSGGEFSVEDLAADRAGIVFATRLNSKKLSLKEVEERFKITAVMPDVDGLSKITSPVKLFSEIDKRIAQLASDPK